MTMITAKAKWNGTEKTVQVPENLSEIIPIISESQKGAIVSITGHKSGSSNKNCITPGLHNRSVITKFNYDKFYAKKAKKIDELTFTEMKELIETCEDLKDVKSKNILFKEIKEKLVDKLKNRENRHERAVDGNDRCYCSIDGVKLHLKTRPGLKKDGEFKGKKLPVTVNDKDWQDPEAIFEADSINLTNIEFKSETITEPVYKENNRSPEAAMEDMIEKRLGPLFQIKSISLGLCNFEKVRINNMEIKPEILPEILD